MSADNWALCPKCLASAKQAYKEEVAKVKNSYGVVSAEDYERMRADASGFARADDRGV